MSAPVAGWYSDPADPSQERWWDAVQWSHTVRPRSTPAAAVPPAPQVAVPPVAVPAAVAPAQPPLIDVPGGGINPFAEMDALESRQAAAVGASFAASPSPVPNWNSAVGRPQYGPPPTNGSAIAGLTLSLLGLFGLGIIFSIRGLLHAAKLARWGDAPVGRKRAAWGLGIGIAAPLTFAALASIIVPIVLAQSENLAADGVLRGPLGLPAVYDREQAEQAIYDTATAQGLNVSDVECPNDAEMVVGGGYECTGFYRGMTHRFGVVWTDTSGSYYSTFDGLILE